MREELYLVHPAPEHKVQYEEMMEEWEHHGGRLNPGALKRWSQKLQKNVSYERWLEWMEEDRQNTQDLFFLTDGATIIGAISIRYKCAGVDGHSGYGIRPSQRGKGYATKMLELAIPILKGYGHEPIILSCDKDNIGSARSIQKNGGVLENEVDDEGEILQRYWIDLSKKG